MIKVDLITGFLGAGKTVFIQGYIQYLKNRGEKLYLIENEFGSVSVDTRLLRNDVENIGDLSGECMCCTGYEDFRQMLIAASKQGFTRILVEPSGIYDVDEFFHIMADREVSEHCEIGSVITIVDPETVQPKDNEQLSKDTAYLMMCQVLGAGCIVLSRTQECSDEEQATAILRLNALLESFDAGRVLTDEMIFTKNWADLTDADYEKITESGYFRHAHERMELVHDQIYSTSFFRCVLENEAQMQTVVEELFTDRSYGTILRVKGYAKDKTGMLYELNCTPNAMSIRQSELKKGVLVVIGQELQEEKIAQRLLSYTA